MVTSQVGGRIAFERRPARLSFVPPYSFVHSAENCDAGPTHFHVHVNDVPADEAKLPVANTFLPRPEPVQPVTLPSVIVSICCPSANFHAR